MKNTKNLIIGLVFLFGMFILFISTIEVPEDSDAELEKVEDNDLNIDYNKELENIINTEKTKTEKMDEVYYLAKTHSNNLTQDEANNYLEETVSDYKSGALKDNLNNDDYAVRIMFKVQAARKALENDFKESENQKSYEKANVLIDFEQIIKYIYREVDDWDSESTISNIDQIEDGLVEIGM